MAQPLSQKRPPAGARAVVIRGASPTHVAAAVRDLVGDGPVAPAGPYGYPFAAVIQLLREAALFHDPVSESVADPLITSEAVCDLLWVLLRRGGRCGFTCADGLDAASAALLRDYASMARLAVSHGFEAGGLVLGTLGALPDALQISDADLRADPATPPPPARLSTVAARALALLEAAPHPVSHASLMQVLGADPSAALRELAAAGMVEAGTRVGLAVPAFPAPSPAWLGSPEVSLPLANLCASGDPAQARHLAEVALRRGDYEIAAFCAAMPGSDPIVAGLAAAHTGRFEVAHAMLELAGDASGLDAARLAALLVAPGLVSVKAADSRLRAAERGGHAVAARACRAGLLLDSGQKKQALNLLRRSTRAELAESGPDVALEHEVALARCEGKLRHPDETRLLCATRGQLRQLARVTGGNLVLPAADFDSTALQVAGHADAHSALTELMAVQPTRPRMPADALAGLFVRLRERGGVLLAARVGRQIVLHPVAAAMHPGLAATMEARLERLADLPGAVGFGTDEFARMGPYSGGSALVVREFRGAGPLIAVFRAGSLPDVRDLLIP